MSARVHAARSPSSRNRIERRKRAELYEYSEYEKEVSFMGILNIAALSTVPLLCNKALYLTFDTAIAVFQDAYVR